ncbi:hypothetical protein SAMN05421686_104218 [Thalassolituus maritimus]|jgi:hypothetical protein|uniref:Uncharacterized protein n=1 Tax=Thalassolituus maritimus TaxID=484498 RepID=A0A1N7LTX1_9GAMM|nr:hypothetical protein [Thalassolituus maritimus]MEC8907358.1 hypothetical protein [Pseudomonadota bacterium]SIS77297.1 hypothetical protein SAMN05421686_104218 [Thalassolituus maritimus]
MLKRLFATRKHPYMPGLNTPEQITVNLSGSVLSLKLPPHYRSDGFEAHCDPIEAMNIYDPTGYGGDPVGTAVFNSKRFISRQWEFFGPLTRLRYIGSISFVAVVERIDSLPEGMSCFNPNHFEQVINRLIFKMGPETPQIAKKIAPVNWRTEVKNGCLWLYYEIHKADDADPESQFSSYAVTPLDDHHYIRLMFHNLGNKPSEHSNRFVNSVRDKVLNSVTLTLSEYAQQRKAEVNSQWPDATISPQRQPYNWIYPEWRDGDTSKGERHVVITQYHTQPPKFHL